MPPRLEAPVLARALRAWPCYYSGWTALAMNDLSHPAIR